MIKAEESKLGYSFKVVYIRIFMEPLSIGYKWYTFKLFENKNVVEIYDREKLLKKVTVIFDSELEKTIKKKDMEITKFFDNILRETGL